MTALAVMLRELYPRALSAVCQHESNLADAQDSLHEALLKALMHWPTKGTPEDPVAWLLAVSLNKRRDRGRRQKRAKHLLSLLASQAPLSYSFRAEKIGWSDELLCLLFSCCDPLLTLEDRAALTLSTLIGMTTQELASAFLVSPETMEQRMVRARRRLRQQGELRLLSTKEAPQRLEAVLPTVYLLFNEGYWSNTKNPIRRELCSLALSLAQSLAAMFPEEPEVLGLVALLTLHSSRMAARLDAQGHPVALPQQDRRLWNQEQIKQGTELLSRATQQKKPGPFQLEAAIALVHCSAKSAEETNWSQLSSLYELLLLIKPSPLIEVNRAYAVAKSKGPSEGLSLLARLSQEALPYAALVRGELLAELEKRQEAAEAFELAIAHARNPAEKEQINQRLKELRALL